VLQKTTAVGGSLDVSLAAPIRTRYLLVHLTALPADGSGGYRGGISEIQVLG
jgi:hypothetical protein